ncbi:MAG: xanthine dehydrogenase family protein molybdopterin-binding subunit [Chloroflexi bacterium]|nr:xanthine dehydrogenase family protein molybdopterin-binding subunit [Chloroflexota bacterium]
MPTAFATVSQRIPRTDGVAKVTGDTRYAVDISLPGMLHCKVLRSPMAHARIKRIDVSRAKAHPGVHSVWTAADFEGTGLHLDQNERVNTILALNEVLYYHQPLVAVLALEASIAEEALDLIELDLEELPAVTDPLASMEPGSPPVRGSIGEVDRSEEQAHLAISTSAAAEVRGKGNVTQRVIYSRGDVGVGFAAADHVISHRWRASWVHQGYLEPHVAIVDFDATGNVRIWTSTQGPYRVREELARFLGIPENHITVEVTELGGGFGGKNRPFDVTLTAALARAARRPVKLALSRSEDTTAGNPAPPAIIDLQTGVKNDGTITAMRARVVFDAGAYPGGPVVGASNLIGSYYRCDNLEIEGFEVLTNRASTGALRAPGTPQVTFALESQVELMAQAIGMDPLEFRLKSAVVQGDLMPNGRPYPRIGLKECLVALQETDFWKRRKQLEPNEGVGFAVGGWLGGTSPAGAVCTFGTDGSINVITGAADISGVNTAFRQIAAEILGVPFDRVTVRQANTSSGPYAGISAGSKTLRTVGMAVKAAATDMRDQLFQLAAQRLEASPVDLEAAEGAIRVKGSPNRGIPMTVMASMTTAMGTTNSLVMGKGSVGSPSQAPSFTVQAVRVHVAPDTGEVTVKEALCIQDVGLAINPTLVESQMQGGAAQSIGIGLWEELQFDDRGIVRNPTLLDYRMPTSLDLPPIETVIVEVPGKEDELWGARGVGESSIISGCAAVANAVADATGARVDTMPLTAERILRTLGRLVSSPL